MGLMSTFRSTAIYLYFHTLRAKGPRITCSRGVPRCLLTTREEWRTKHNFGMESVLAIQASYKGGCPSGCWNCNCIACLHAILHHPALVRAVCVSHNLPFIDLLCASIWLVGSASLPQVRKLLLNVSSRLLFLFYTPQIQFHAGRPICNASKTQTSTTVLGQWFTEHDCMHSQKHD